MSNVSVTVANHLCTSCGVCKAVCPRQCISWQYHEGMYEPKIDAEACIECGLCASVCPGLGHVYETKGTSTETVTGPVRECFNAWSKNPVVRHVSASGGVVSTVTKILLDAGKYDVAFSVDTYDYREQLKMKAFTKEGYGTDWEQSSTPKSRYLPVSHETTVSYIRQHPDQRAIIVGSPCALRGIQAAMKKLHLDREHYLLIGLFCDKIFNYNAILYFQNQFCNGKELRGLHFKNKESGGWPGDMKLFPAEGETFYVPLQERAQAKAYFMPERCLYCVDKLNATADISLGDNYTGIHSSELGSNSVIVRTQRGAQAWKDAEDGIEALPVELESVQKAQAVDDRLVNMYFGDMKTAKIQSEMNLNAGVARDFSVDHAERAYKLCLKRLQAGAVYAADPNQIKNQIVQDHKKPNPAVRFIKRGLRFIKRRVFGKGKPAK